MRSNRLITAVTVMTAAVLCCFLLASCGGDGDASSSSGGGTNSVSNSAPSTSFAEVSSVSNETSDEVSSDEVTSEISFEVSSEEPTSDDASSEPSVAPSVVEVTVNELDVLAEGDVTVGGGKVIYTFKAPVYGFYTVGFGFDRFNDHCTYTSDHAEGSVFGPNDLYFTFLSEGEELKITAQSASDAPAGTVSMIFSEAVSQPFPAEGWASGTYTSGEEHTLLLDRDAMTVTVDDGSAISVMYWEGKGYFVSVVDGEYVLFDIACDAEGNITVSSPDSSVTYAPVVIPTVDQFAGAYEYEDDEGNVTKLIIESDGSGRIGNDAFTINLYGAWFDGETGILYWQNYWISVASVDEDGNATVLSVYNEHTELTTLYNLKSRTVVSIPSELPIEYGSKYAGTRYEIASISGVQKWNVDYTLTIVDLIDGYYVISEYNMSIGDYETFLLELVYEGDSVSSIIVYNEERVWQDELRLASSGTAPVKVSDLITDGETENKQNDFNIEGYGFFAVPETGYYTFFVSENGNTALYTDCERQGNIPVCSGMASFGIGPNGVTKYLTKGTLLAVSRWFANDPFTVTYSRTAPAGFAASNPVILTTDGFDVTKAPIDEKFFLSFTAPEAGTYTFSLPEDYIYGGFTINGITYGYRVIVEDWGSYPEKTNNDVCVMELSAGQKITIVVCRSNDWDYPCAMLTVSDGNGGSSATDPEEFFTEDQIGTYATSGVSLTIHEDKTVDYYSSDNGGTLYGLAVTKNGNNYSFEYELETLGTFVVEFSFRSDGSIRLFDGPDYLLTKDGDVGSEQCIFPPYRLSTYVAWEQDMAITLTLHKNNTVTLHLDDTGDSEELPVTLNDGKFTFTCSYHGEPTECYFFFNEGEPTLTLNLGMREIILSQT